MSLQECVYEISMKRAMSYTHNIRMQRYTSRVLMENDSKDLNTMIMDDIIVPAGLQVTYC